MCKLNVFQEKLFSVLHKDARTGELTEQGKFRVCVVGNKNNHKQPEMKEWEETNTQPPSVGCFAIENESNKRRGRSKKTFLTKVEIAN